MNYQKTYFYFIFILVFTILLSILTDNCKIKRLSHYSVNDSNDSIIQNITNDEYLIYSAVMIDNFPNVEEYVVYKFTEPDNHLFNTRFEDHLINNSIDDSMIQNYLHNNKTTVEIRNIFSINSKVILTDWSWDNDPQMNKFHELINDGHGLKQQNTSWLIYLSRVGFDEDNEKAFMTFTAWLGPKAAYGILYYLEKEDDKWIVINKDELWES